MQQQALDEAHLESLFLTAFELLPDSALQTMIDDLVQDYNPESHPDDGYDYDL